MLILFESPNGYALFKVINEGKLKDIEDLSNDKISECLKLQAFHRFSDTNSALSSLNLISKSELPIDLESFLKSQIKKDSLLLLDPKLAGIIKDKTGILTSSSPLTIELSRLLRSHFSSKDIDIDGNVKAAELRAKTLGLGHAMVRDKLRFSPDKVDTMIIQSINLLDELDKQLNVYSMRLAEWYGYRFPELKSIVKDSVTYAKTIIELFRIDEDLNISSFSIPGIDPVTVEAIFSALKTTMGTQLVQEDIDSILSLANEIVELSRYRSSLEDYLLNRMAAIAPNLTQLVGETVGARLIAKAGSLVNLAKQPASTVQILGAEKALFRALKQRMKTPKYGLIYHAQFVGQATPKNKGKIARVLAAKAALAVRVDAFGEGTSVGNQLKATVASRLRMIEGHAPITRGDSSSENGPKIATPSGIYNVNADITMMKKEVIEKKKKKKEKRKREDDADVPTPIAESNTPNTEEVIKKKKKKKVENIEEE